MTWGSVRSFYLSITPDLLPPFQIWRLPSGCPTAKWSQGSAFHLLPNKSVLWEHGAQSQIIWDLEWVNYLYWFSGLWNVMIICALWYPWEYWVRLFMCFCSSQKAYSSFLLSVHSSPFLQLLPCACFLEVGFPVFLYMPCRLSVPLMVEHSETWIAMSSLGIKLGSPPPSFLKNKHAHEQLEE